MKHYHLNECDSTQDVLKEQLRTNADSETILVSCENQLKGRGRGENIWTGMSGTVCFSLSIDAHPIPSFTAIEISVLVAIFFESKNLHLRLKWPNDLFTIAEKKCGGILVQSTSNNKKMMMGIGLNLYSDDLAFGGVFDSPFLVDKKVWSHELADFILSHRYIDSQALKRDWLSRCLHLDASVEIHEAGEMTSGEFIGLGEYGEALISSAGKISRIFNGSLRRTISR